MIILTSRGLLSVIVFSFSYRIVRSVSCLSCASGTVLSLFLHNAVSLKSKKDMQWTLNWQDRKAHTSMLVGIRWHTMLIFRDEKSLRQNQYTFKACQTLCLINIIRVMLFLNLFIVARIHPARFMNNTINFYSTDLCSFWESLTKFLGRTWTFFSDSWPFFTDVHLSYMKTTGCFEWCKTCFWTMKLNWIES